MSGRIPRPGPRAVPDPDPATDPVSAARGPGTRVWLWIAAVLFVWIFVLRVLVPGTEHPIALLYAIPVLIVAIERGVRAGIAAALLAVGLAAIWDFGISPEPPHAFEEYVVRAVVVLVLAASVGALANRLRASIETQARFWELSTDLLATTDNRGRFTHLSPSWTRELGWTPEELTSRPFIEFVHPDDRPATLAEFVRVIEEGKGSDFENRYMRSDGEYRRLQWRAKTEPTTGVIYAAARDITERGEIQRRLEEAVAEANAANEAKSEFLSRMSHELRTPLNAILGFTQLLEIAELEPSDREAVTHIREGGDHLLRLVNELLEISVIETGHIRVQLAPVPLDEITSEVLALIEPLASDAGVRLSGGCEQEIAGAAVLADRQRLTQVLINLVTNAVKYNRAGGSVSLTCEPAGAGRACFVIADDGPGMDAEQIRAVFVPFERLGAEGGRVEGTGLGLPLAKRLVDVMGGTLEPESEPGRGTTMRVGLPLASGDRPASRPTQIPTLPILDEGRADRRTVVYVEDDDASTELVQRALEWGGGVRLVSAVSGERGLELIREHRPDLVLLDLDLPDISGGELLGRIKADPTLARIPVIVVSAATTEGQAQRLLAAGAAAYLTKPVEVARLLELTFDIASGRERELGPL